MNVRAFLLVLAVTCVAAVPASSVAEVVASVVEVRASGSTGTGFVIEGDRVVTAAHVVESSPVTIVTADGSRAATIVRHEPAVDLAVLEVEGDLDLRPLALSEELPTTAENVFAATAQPFGTAATISQGIVSGVVQQASGTVVQTDAAVNPGSSGGPLVREDGVVVGVTSSKLDGAEGVAFAIPTTTLIQVLAEGGRGAAANDDTAATPGDGSVTDESSPDRSPTTVVQDWLPVTVPAVLLLAVTLVGRVLERRRRRRPAPPGPFDIDVRLHDARTTVPARPDHHEDA